MRGGRLPCPGHADDANDAIPACCNLPYHRVLLVRQAFAQRLGKRALDRVFFERRGVRVGAAVCEREGRLPKVSELLPEALEDADLPGIVKTVIAAIPDGTVDSALPTGPLLRRAIDELDVDQLVRDLDDPDQLESAIRTAILQAARDQILDRLRP